MATSSSMVCSSSEAGFLSISIWLSSADVDSVGKIRTKVEKCFHAHELSMKFIMLINVKMPFFSMINITAESLKARNVSIQYFSFYEQFKFHAPLSCA